MKFKDLEEGKNYKLTRLNKQTSEGYYIIKDKLLWSCNAKRFTGFTHEEISNADFEEVVEYVSFEEAVKHMKKGNKAKFEGAEYRIQSGCIGYGYDYFVSADMELVFFKPKWILL
jgi:hypothetical protein